MLKLGPMVLFDFIWNLEFQSVEKVYFPTFFLNCTLSQESEDEPAPQQVSEDLLADMKKRREQTKKIKARAQADFEKVIQEETAKQQTVC